MANDSHEEFREEYREVFVISVAAELSGMHAQTLRTYDRMGLVSPARTRGGGRRYSQRDIAMLRKIQQLSQDDGVNLAGIKAIIELTEQRDALAEERDALAAEVEELRGQLRTASNRAPANASKGELVHVPRSSAVVMWEPRSSRRGRGRRN
ncbi:helix-turn-helix transcriptional regulator [Corynebacterium propinquum]|uniref:Helix-turn-helix transcriptional regulator n=1 Tax=Corynebacterium propinquum TaxID=43769 RepID=A0AAP4BRM3_9CORY|nr:helix-turn-helix transcriptional regulator [Corynebacterium propinquum]MCG7231247.1 helix-turn-helix transcriptional regulator [Corynebacterium propinquum]MDK4325110.1 helix-turn-helix transcriptional regulator [Corynebacterium propinquum]MDK8535527.1 helix-turn-helix transcriptional regulator [Corynebacterium propinquum]MDK8722006.1 helix-turn-helix transcriptional regulator [Corynebacterium propinquum]UQV60562.1 helix-turn-helix transcriptional regulator [Corynebacterium propinquum]